MPFQGRSYVISSTKKKKKKKANVECQAFC